MCCKKLVLADLHMSSCFARFAEKNISQLTAFACIFRQTKIAKNSPKIFRMPLRP